MRRQSFHNLETLHRGVLVVALLLGLCINDTQSFVPSTPVSSTHRSSPLYGSSDDGTQEGGWQYRGHHVHTEVRTPDTTTSLPAVLLIHGFGCSTTYWRRTSDALVARGHTVHALDLLGQGRSAKPGRADGVEYSIDLWAGLVDAYAREHVALEEPASSGLVLAGNSLGSTVVLSAVTGDFAAHGNNNNDVEPYLSSHPDALKGVCMFNCGVGLNSRGIVNEPQWSPLQKWLLDSVYAVLTFFIFGNRPLLTYVLDEVVTKELLRDTLRSLYKTNPDHVDDELVDSFFDPAQDSGSPEALSQIYCNDPGPTPFYLHDRYREELRRLPIHLVWGDEDAVTPLDGGVGQFYLAMAQDQDTNVSFRTVQSGHVPFDDNPTDSNGSLLQWLEDVVVAK